ncbi:hypothetical protein Tco_1374552 [Tanacetum coccineum]
MEAEVDQYVVDKKCGEIERKNLLITNENLIANCIAQDVFYTVTDSALSAPRFHELSTAYNVAMTRAVEIKAENSKLLEQIQNDDHHSMVMNFSKLEIAHLNLQLKYQHLKENIENFKSKPSKDIPEFDAFFEISNQDAQIQDHRNTIRVTSDVKLPKVSAFEKYAIDVEPIPPRQRNNRVVHHGYLNRLKDTLDTLREIVEEARSQLPSDRVNTATIANGSKPRSNTKKDRTLPAKIVMKQVESHSRMNKLNEKQKNRVDSSISYKRTMFVKQSPEKDRTLPAKSALKQVEGHSRMNKSNEKQKNHVDSSISYKRTQSPATKVWRVKQVWKAKGKLFTTIGHQWRPTDRLLPLGDQWPLTRNTPPKVLPTKQWKPTSRLLPLGRQCPLVRSTALKSDCLPADPQESIAPVAYNFACTNQPDPNCNWGSNVSKSPFSPLFKGRLYRSFSGIWT